MEARERSDRRMVGKGGVPMTSVSGPAFFSPVVLAIVAIVIVVAVVIWFVTRHP